jgi:hypothetical protein
MQTLSQETCKEIFKQHENIAKISIPIGFSFFHNFTFKTDKKVLNYLFGYKKIFFQESRTCLTLLKTST